MPTRTTITENSETKGPAAQASNNIAPMTVPTVTVEPFVVDPVTIVAPSGHKQPVTPPVVNVAALAEVTARTKAAKAGSEKPAKPKPAVPPTATDAAERRTLGRYALISKIASGGMGEVYLARPKGAAPKDKLVAVKLLLPALSKDAQMISMFVNEARVASRLSHPNLCHVYEFGVDDAELFIAMEYFEGMTLATAMRERSWAGADPRIASAIVQQVCTGLHYAHELKGEDGKSVGLVHRDISPPNIFLTAAGEVKVLDFGIAKVNDTLLKTRSGVRKGKCAYMSPEQAHSFPLDRRSDVFSLGIVLYETLLRRRLFARKSDYQTGRAISEEEAPSVCERRPELPPELGEVVAKALQKAPEDRFATALEFRDALAEASRGLGEPLEAAELAAYFESHHQTALEHCRKQIAAARKASRGRASSSPQDASEGQQALSVRPGSGAPPRTEHATRQSRDAEPTGDARALMAMATETSLPEGRLRWTLALVAALALAAIAAAAALLLS